MFSQSWQVGKPIANYFRYTVGRVADRGRGLICAVARGDLYLSAKMGPTAPRPTPSPPSTPPCNISLLSDDDSPSWATNYPHPIPPPLLILNLGCNISLTSTILAAMIDFLVHSFPFASDTFPQFSLSHSFTRPIHTQSLT